MGILKLFKRKPLQDAELPPINGGRRLPTRIEDFEWCHYKVLRRLRNHPVNEKFTGYMTLEVDIPKFIPILIDLGLVEIGSYEDGLKALKIDDLKSILRQAGLKVAGNKAALIERIMENFDEDDVRRLHEYTDIYVYTEITKPVINASYDKFDEERSAFFQEAMEFILSGDLNKAYRMICKRNAEMPVPPGMKVDWDKRYYEGLKKDEQEVYENQLRKSPDKEMVAMAIYQSMGGTLREVRQYKESSISEKSEIRQAESYISAERHRQQYIKSDTKKYRFLASLDDMTCPICGELDGKVFDVDQIVYGVNYPPMHDGCRCTTIAAFEGITPKGTRFARDPVTHRGIKVPSSMTYEEYKKEYLMK